MGPVIQEFLFCLLPAAAIGAVVGWMLKKLTVEEQQVGITRFELEVKLTAAERKILALQRELETAQAGAHAKGGQASMAVEEVAHLKAQVLERDELVQGLRARLATLESMPVKVASQEATIADLRGRLAAVESLAEVLSERERELAEVRLQLVDMVPRLQLEEQQGHLQERVETLERNLAETKSIAEQEETWARQVLSERDGTIEHLHEELARFQRSLSDLTTVKNQLSEREESIAALRHELAQAQGLQQEGDRLQSLVQAREEEIRRLRQQVAETEQQVQQGQELVAQLEGAVQDREELREMVSESERRLAEREDDIQRLQAQLKDMVPALEVEKLRAKLKAAKEQKTQPEVKEQTKEQAEMFVEAAPEPSLPKWGASPPDRLQSDDLKRIWGVGPALERLLHKQGIYYFRQIASWTKDDIQQIDQKLDVFKGRIQRDNWIKGAKDEHFRKYGERL